MASNIVPKVPKTTNIVCRNRLTERKSTNAPRSGASAIESAHRGDRKYLIVNLISPTEQELLIQSVRALSLMSTIPRPQHGFKTMRSNDFSGSPGEVENIDQ
jgi:hypothetical protein